MMGGEVGLGRKRYVVVDTLLLLHFHSFHRFPTGSTPRISRLAPLFVWHHSGSRKLPRASSRFSFLCKSNCSAYMLTIIVQALPCSFLSTHK